MLSRSAPILVLLALVLASGLAHGLRTDRWRKARSLEEALDRLDRVPMAVGDWEGADIELARRQLEVGQIDGHVARRYRNRRDGREVTMLLVCGRPGPIAVHTPDVCYAGVGYTPSAPRLVEPIRTASSSRPISFKTAEFRKDDALVPESLQIYWSWTAGDAWEAPELPRPHFVGEDFLYKLYVIGGRPGEDITVTDRACRDFLGVFVPGLGRALAPPGDPGPPGADVRVHR